MGWAVDVRRQPGKTLQTDGVFRLSVIVDIVFEDGLLFISVKNMSDEPAFKVSAKFDKKIVGVDGRKEISSLPLFRNIEFLAPHKEIRTFLDSSRSYFARRQPDKISVKVSYRNKEAELVTGTINHDLGIYREIGYIRTVGEKEESKQ